MRSNLILFIFLSLLFSSCKNKKKEAAQVVPEVNVIVVGQRNIPVYDEYVGETYGQSDI